MRIFNTKLPQDAHPRNLMQSNQSNYRLQFQYQEWARLEGPTEFTREKVGETFGKIYKYAKDELSGWRRAAVVDLDKKLDHDLEAYRARTGFNFYRYGQPSSNS